MRTIMLREAKQLCYLSQKWETRGSTPGLYELFTPQCPSRIHVINPHSTNICKATYARTFEALSLCAHISYPSKNRICPGRCGSAGWSVIPWPKGYRFDSWSGHTPRLWVRSSLLDPQSGSIIIPGPCVRGRQPMDASLPPFLCLWKQWKDNVLRWGWKPLPPPEFGN